MYDTDDYDVSNPNFSYDYDESLDAYYVPDDEYDVPDSYFHPEEFDHWSGFDTLAEFRGER